MIAADFIGGAWVTLPQAGGHLIESTNPARPNDRIWRACAEPTHVDHAVAAARSALPSWSARPQEERAACLKSFAERAANAVPDMAALITREVGKTLAESTLEAKLLADKVAITLEPASLARVTEFTVPAGPTRQGHCRFKPFGVMAVIGPFNFPAHLPNGHIVPALLLGNTVVFKPSEKAPAVGQMLAELIGSSVPPGVFNVVQGPGSTAAALTAHNDIDGILFTGSWPVGRSILQANLDNPGRMIALEMGGSNPAVVLADADLKLAVTECARAAFATTGQRCTCTRRIIVEEGIAERFVPAFVRAAASIVVGPGDSTEPVFMGPLISHAAREAVLAFQRQSIAHGARPLLRAEAVAPVQAPEGWFISPGVLQVDRFELETDCEVFGPLVQIAVARNLDDAIVQANASQFGLAAAIFTRSQASFERFFRGCKSGCINWNTGTAGASSKLPFGGLGKSGNLRPAAAFSVDYCALPIASMVEQGHQVAVPPGMTVE
jgi:succinylglutamic semialdehyde dehydrogenase